jgi:hypothetical protein
MVSHLQLPFRVNTVPSVKSSGPAVHYDDDKAVRTTPWIEMVSKKKRRPDTFRSEYIRSGALRDK